MEEISISNPKGIKLHCRIDNAGKRDVILFCHGLFGSMEHPILTRARRAFSQAGFTVFSFDYSGHGRSRGDRHATTITDAIGDTSSVISHIRDRYSPRRLFLLGYSFGSYVVLMTASRDRGISGIFLVNPVSDILSLVLSKESGEAMGKYTDALKKVSVIPKARFFLDMLKYRPYSSSKEITCPVFTFHSKDDDIVPYMQSEKLMSKIQGKKELMLIQGENHICSCTTEFEDNVLPRAIKWLKDKA